MFGSDKKPYIIIRAALFVLVFFALFTFFEALTYDHDKVFDGWAYVYETDIDVLIMGSSQAASFDAAYITEQTGKNTVILSSGAQSAKQIYYNLVEVLKYQKPGLIVIEEFSIIEDTDSWMRENGLYGLALANLDGMKMSPTKLTAAFACAGFESYGVFHTMREAGKTERLIHAATHLPLQIKRLFTPKERNLSPLKGTILHQPETMATEQQYEESLLREADGSFTLPDENVKYMDKIIELCQKHGVKIEFIKTPLIKNQSSVSGHPKIAEHMKEKGYDVAAYNMMDSRYGLDMLFEDYTDVNHVSISGMRKISDWLAGHINEMD